MLLDLEVHLILLLLSHYLLLCIKLDLLALVFGPINEPIKRRQKANHVSINVLIFINPKKPYLPQIHSLLFELLRIPQKVKFIQKDMLLSVLQHDEEGSRVQNPSEI